MILKTVIFLMISINAHARMDFVSFINQVKKQKASTVSEGISVLPREYKINYTLMKVSSSIQSSTPLNPRAILFGNTGETIYTFNGDNKHAGYSSIEVAENTGTDLQFSEIIFKKNETIFYKAFDKHDYKQKYHLEKNEILYEDDLILVSKPNPKKCMQCHGIDNNNNPLEMARYIWSPYNFWTGAYGENDDGIEPNSQEDILFQKFKAHAKTHKRYKQLKLEAPKLEVFYYPYYSSSKLENKAINLAPNFRLTSLIALNYADLVSKKIISTLIDVGTAKDIYKKSISKICSPKINLEYYYFKSAKFLYAQNLVPINHFEFNLIGPSSEPAGSSIDYWDTSLSTFYFNPFFEHSSRGLETLVLAKIFHWFSEVKSGIIFDPINKETGIAYPFTIFLLDSKIIDLEYEKIYDPEQPRSLVVPLTSACKKFKLKFNDK